MLWIRGKKKNFPNTILKYCTRVLKHNIHSQIACNTDAPPYKRTQF
jgi:hypothetical protein